MQDVLLRTNEAGSVGFAKMLVKPSFVTSWWWLCLAVSREQFKSCHLLMKCVDMHEWISYQVSISSFA